MMQLAAQRHLAYHVGCRQAHQHDLGPRGDLGRRGGEMGAARDQRFRGLGRQVVDAQPVARVEQAGSHRTAHAPDADEAQQPIRHDRSSACFLGIATIL
jgi:hypothetical protein